MNGQIDHISCEMMISKSEREVNFAIFALPGIDFLPKFALVHWRSRKEDRF
jgi:hypothetical protein